MNNLFDAFENKYETIKREVINLNQISFSELQMKLDKVTRLVIEWKEIYVEIENDTYEKMKKIPGDSQFIYSNFDLFIKVINEIHFTNIQEIHVFLAIRSNDLYYLNESVKAYKYLIV